MRVSRALPLPPDLTALAIFALLTVLFSLPVLRDPAHLTFPTISRDNIGNFWFLWWVKEAVRHGSSLFWTDLIYYPWGVNLAFTEFSPLYGLLSTPFLLFWDSPAALVLIHNLWTMVSFVLTGYATFLFARRESGSTAGGMLAGLILSFAAFRFHHLEHLNLLSTYWIPLAAWTVGQWCFPRPASGSGRGPSRWWLLGVGICGLGLAGTSTTLLMIAGLFLAGWIGLTLVLSGKRKRPGLYPRLGVAAFAFVLGTLPVTWPWVAGSVRGLAPIAPPAEVRLYGPDLVGFFLPERSLILGPLVKSLGIPHHGPGGDEIYLGLAGLVLAMVGAATARARALPFLLTAVFAFLLSLGPGLWVANRHHDLPFSLFGFLERILPPLHAVRTPERFIVGALLALAVLSAIGLSRVAAGRRGRVLVGLVFAATLVELFPAIARPENIQVSPVYRRMARDPAPGAVLEFAPKHFSNPDFLFHQSIHRRPLTGDVLSRPPSNTRSLVRELDLYRRFSLVSAAPEVVGDLRAAGVSFLVFHARGLKPEEWRALVSLYAGHAETWYQEESLVAFKLVK